MDSTLRFTACCSPSPIVISSRKRRRSARLGVAAALLGFTGMFAAEPAAAYVIDNLVSDLPGVAATVDPNLVNPWGLVHSATSPWWVSDNGTGVSTLYNGAGHPFPLASPLVVTIPVPGGGASAPTGVVFNSTSSFGGNKFIFATEDGTIAAWSGGSTAALKDITTDNAVYKGLAIGNDGTRNLLYATDFHNGAVKVFDSGFTQTTVPGGFTDPTLPTGYAPFGIQNIGGKLYVTYAKQDAAAHDDEAGPGHGFVDEFDTNGNLLKRIASDDTLNSPWGLALAPNDFGPFSNDLLVGNFGDGRINAFDLSTDTLVGQLDDGHGNPLVIEGLWGLGFGNGGNAGPTDFLYFTAGIPGPGDIEDHGLFGFIAAPEPSSLALLISGLAAFGLRRRRRSDATA